MRPLVENASLNRVANEATQMARQQNGVWVIRGFVTALCLFLIVRIRR